MCTLALRTQRHSRAHQPGHNGDPANKATGSTAGYAGFSPHEQTHGNRSQFDPRRDVTPAFPRFVDPHERFHRLATVDDHFAPSAVDARMERSFAQGGLA